MQIKRAFELDQRRSFSFSSFDFNNSSLFSSSSSDDDCFASCNFVMYDSDDDDGDDDSAYIEINLNPQPTRETVGINKRTEEKESNSAEVELRISFSSAGIETTSCGTTQHAQGTSITKPKLGLFVSLARIVNDFIAASNSVTPIEADNVGRAHLPPLSKADHKEIMLHARKDCTMVANSKRNGIMNFILKFQYKNIPSVLVSMVTPKPKTRGQTRARQPLLRRGRRYPMKLKSTCNHSEDVEREKSTLSSVGSIINFKAMRGVLDALIVRTSARTGRLSASKQNNKSKSCPSSIKSSPVHNNNVFDHDEVRGFYSRDNSAVQAAIAHCKKSFGFGTQTEFHFHPSN